MALPDDRAGITRRFGIPYYEKDADGKDVRRELKFYVTANTFEDGRLREIFVRADKGGSFTSGALDAFAIAFSLGLQHGVPLALMIEKLKGLRFDPEGRTGDDEFPICASAIDLLMRWVEKRFVKKEEGCDVG